MDMYKVVKTNTQYYPYVLLLLQDVGTVEKKWWVYTYVYDEDLCEDYKVKDLTGTELSQLPEHGGWIEKEEIRSL